MSTKVSLAMLFLGLAMLWPVPLGGALLLVSAGVGLAISWEADMVGDPQLSAAAPPWSPDSVPADLP